MKIFKDNKIQSISNIYVYLNDKIQSISNIYTIVSGKTILLWTSIKDFIESVFGSGWWSNTSGWDNTQGWKNEG